MSCLTGYIGIKGVDDVPLSGLYINDLAGISTELIDKIADCEKVDFEGMWSSIQIRSYAHLVSDVIGYMATKAMLEQEVYQTKRFSTRGKSIDPVSASSEWRGCYVRLPESKYSKLYIKNLYVYSLVVETTVLRVYDAQDGEQLYEQEIDLSVGFNTIQVEQDFGLRFRNTELLIVVDCTNVDTIKTDSEYYHFWGQDSCGCNFNNFGHSDYPEIIPATLPYGENPINDNIDTSAHGKGVWIDASLICSVDEFICQNKGLLKTAWWYLLGREVLTEKLAGSRVNYFASGNLERTAWLRDGADNNASFQRTYKHMLKNALNGINIEGDLICFNCFESTEIKTGTIVP
jgi:hypothetical protein